MSELARGSIATILFTDLVDSTVLMQRLGDERAQRVFEPPPHADGQPAGRRSPAIDEDALHPPWRPAAAASPTWRYLLLETSRKIV